MKKTYEIPELNLRDLTKTVVLAGSGTGNDVEVDEDAVN